MRLVVRGAAAWVRRFHALSALLAYAFIALYLTYPLVLQSGSALPSDAGDPILNTWILSWNARSLPFTTDWWNAPVFYPAEGVLAFSENLLGLSILSTPVIWLTNNPLLAYNLVFLLSFPLSGAAAYLLAFELTRRRDAAWVAGLLFAFCPYRMEQLSHLQVLVSFWMPLALFGLQVYLRDGRARWLVLFGSALLFQGLSNLYFLLFFPVLVAMWLLWFTPTVGRWRTLACVGIAWVVASLPLVPLLLTYQAVHDRFSFVRSPGEMREYSADVMALFSASSLLSLWGWLDHFKRAEGSLFPGLTVVLLVGLALARRRWRGLDREVTWLTKLRAVLGIATVGLALVLASRLAFGPWKMSLLGIGFSVTRWENTLSLVVLFGLAFGLLSPHLIRAKWWRSAGFCLLAGAVVWRLALGPFPTFMSVVVLFGLAFGLLSPHLMRAKSRRSAFGFYLLAGAVMWMLTLGPVPRFMGEPFLYQSPYAWLMVLPGFDGLRVPARFWMLAVVCLSTAGGLAYARLVPSSSRRWSVASIALVTVGGLSDTWINSMPIAELPARSAILERFPAAGPVLELPLDSGNGAWGAMYRSMFHGRPIVNGASGHSAPHYPALVGTLASFDGTMLTELSRLGVRDVRIDRAADVDGAYRRYVSRHPGAQLVAEGDGEAVYRLSPATRPTADIRSGPEIPIERLEANVNDDRLGRLTDHDLLTRWDTGPQVAGRELRLDLGEVRLIGAISMSLGSFTDDFPRQLLVEISPDGTEWIEVWRGPTAAKAVMAALIDPVEMSLDIPVNGRAARFARLRLLGGDPVFYWSIAELRVFAPSS